MSTSNGVDSSSFSRSDVIKTYMVVEYFGGILTQYPIVTNIDYDSITSTITANNLISNEAGTGTSQTSLTLRGANSASASRPGGSVSISAGGGLGGSSGGSVTLSSGNGGLGASSVTINSADISALGIKSETLTISDGGVIFLGGYSDTGEINFSAGYNAAGTAGRPITLNTDSGPVLQAQEATLGTPTIGFFNKSPLAPKQTTAVTGATYTAGTTAGTFHTDDKYGGYTVGQIVAALKAYGLLA